MTINRHDMQEILDMNAERVFDTDMAKFEEEGFVILRDFLASQVIADVRRAVEELQDEKITEMLVDGRISDPCTEEPFLTRMIKVVQQSGEMPLTDRAELHRAGMFGLFFHARLLDKVEAILGPEIRLYPNYSIRPKMPDNEATLVLWHQDAAYTATGELGSDPDAKENHVDELRMVNVWTPIVPARVENGCMQFIPGTHKLGLVPHDSKEYYLEIVADEIEPRESEAVDIELDPGNIVLFSNLLFHRGLPNRTQGIRWSCDWRYQDATQSTMRADKGQIARSRRDPSSAVQDREQWASLNFV